MKKLLLLTLFTSFNIGLIAQPVITSENVYLIGDQTEIAWCSNPTAPGVAGADVIWDFSDLNEIEEQVFDYIDPSSTIFGYQFPNSTLCGVGSDNYHSFYSVSDEHLIVEGYAGYEQGSMDTIKILYSDVEEFIPIPFEFGDTHFDTFEGATEALGFAIPFEGEIDLEVDGYGTLILPNGTFENAVRYHFNRTQENTILGQTTTNTKEQWGWMSPDYRFWLCLMEINNDGFGDEDVVWYSKNPLTLSTEVEERETVEIYPNPLSVGESLQFNFDAESSALIELYSLQGRKIESFRMQVHTGENRISFRKNLPAGVYSLRIITETKHLTAKLLIKNP